MSPALTRRQTCRAAILFACTPMLPHAASGAAATFDLVTADEALREATAPKPARSRAMPPGAASAPVLAPTIQVIAPQGAGNPLSSPLRIEVAFKPPPDARIVPSSFRLLYGVLKIDLTDRVNKHATIRETGVVVSEARVPDGTHRLIVRVADDKGRFGEQELLIRVAAAR
ncbi:conserved exported hypothetical protein [Rubrivivax sp. A210]|uniref:hypothetical protein n=1 Tax=Rubrivivax sp. A210 TaxID=2772301 RepID=UPI00191B894F|nr:hypothetical protein [Rubrivivax sp. A210]CAD5374291.1 conserved exported hypothetical protein [Rubrivivax sp. A210]